MDFCSNKGYFEQCKLDAPLIVQTDITYIMWSFFNNKNCCFLWFGSIFTCLMKKRLISERMEVQGSRIAISTDKRPCRLKLVSMVSFTCSYFSIQMIQLARKLRKVSRSTLINEWKKNRKLRKKHEFMTTSVQHYV